MPLRLIFLLCPIILLFSMSDGHAENTVHLKSSYLQSIYEDSRVFLEGIELFIRRDYPRFWSDIENGTPMDKKEIHRYLNDLNHFEGLIDALYKEFFSFKTANENIETIKQPDQKIVDLQNQIFQMLAFSYMKIGDFSMAQALMKQGNVNDKNYLLQIRDIEGLLKNFPLTERLNKLSLIINNNLNMLELHLKYFLPTDMQTLNAYLKISGYDGNNPFNLTFIDFYGRRFPGLTNPTGNVIHLREIARYFNRLKYNNIYKDELSVSKGPHHTISYEFPILKGDYSLVLNDDNHVVLDFAESKVLTIERLCHFKGFVRTDFRKLKGEEKKNLKIKNIIDKSLTLESVGTQFPGAEQSQKTTMVFKPGEKVRYGLYRLYERGNLLGVIDLVPSIVGDDIKKRDMDKKITRIKVFNHELLFYQDTLDLIASNQNTYGNVAETASPSAIDPNAKVDQKSKSKSGPTIHLFRGCSHRQAGE